MTIKLYKYTGKAIYINKNPLLSDPLTITDSHVAGNQDMEAPILIVSGTGSNAALDYNYVYIQDWGRYYFITKRNWLADSTYQLFLQEDYIYTGRTMILAQTGYCRYSGLGDGNQVDSRAIIKPQATIKRYNVALTSTNSTGRVYCMRFYSSDPVIPGEIPTPLPAVVGLNQSVVFLSDASLATFLGNYAALSESDRVAVGKAIISINLVPYPGYLTSNALDVTKIQFKTPFASGAIQVACTGAWPGLDYAKMIPSCQEVYDAIAPVSYQVEGSTPGTPYSFNPNNRFYLLDGKFTLRMHGLNPIDINPAAYGLSGAFNIKFDIMYEPFTEQYVINLFPTVQSGKYTPILQKSVLSMPFMSDTSFDQFALNTISNTMGLLSGLGNGITNIAGGLATGNAVGAITGGANLVSNFSGYIANQERMALNEQIGYSVSGTPGIGIYYSKGIENGNYLYHAYHEPVMLPWSHKGIPDGAWRSLLTLEGTGYAEVDLVDIDSNTQYLTQSEIQKIVDQMAAGVIFNASSP